MWATQATQAQTYRLYDPKTKKINISRDVTWLNKTYGDWKGITQSKITRLSQAIVIRDDGENIKESNPITRNENNRMETQQESQQQNQHTTNKMQKSNASTTNHDIVDSTVKPRVRQELELWSPPEPTLRRTRFQTRIANAHSESKRENDIRSTHSKTGRKSEANQA